MDKEEGYRQEEGGENKQTIKHNVQTNEWDMNYGFFSS